MIQLGSILEMIKGKKPSSVSDQPTEGYLPYVDIEAFEKGVIKQYTNDSKCVRCNDGDLLIVCDGSRSGLVGRAVNGYVGSTLAVVKADGLINDYLYYCIQGKYRLLNTKKKGTGTPHLNAELLKQSSISIPSIAEQERIVARIEEMFSELDAGVETLKKTKAQLAVYRQAVLKEAFKRAGGEQEPIKNLCFFITKGTTPSKNELHSKSGDVPFIKVYNLTFDNTLDFTIEPTFVDKDTHLSFLSRSIVYPGDVLMNIVGPPMGKVSIVPNTYPEWNINQAIARFRCLERINNKYLAYYLGYAGTVEKMKSKAKATAGQFNLTLEICRELTINLPCIEKQEQIIDEIEEKLSQCIKIEQTVNSALHQAEAMRQSILKDAFEGRI